MTPQLFAVTAPLAIAALVWGLSGWHRGGKLGKSLPTFLLGYIWYFAYAGFSDEAHKVRSTTPSEYALSIFIFTILCYTFGGIGWLCLITLKELFLSALHWWLTTPYDSASPEGSYIKGVTSLDVETAVQRSRQQTIEECAAEAYEHFMSNEVEVGIDSDRAEITAGRLRDAILALGEEA
jgi:hypothetical protein